MTYTEKTRTIKRITKEEEKLLQNKTNRESLAVAIGTLENIQTNYSYKINRNSKRLILELLDLLKHEGQNSQQQQSVHQIPTATRWLEKFSYQYHREIFRL